MGFRRVLSVVHRAEDTTAAIDLEVRVEFTLMEILSSSRGQKSSEFGQHGGSDCHEEHEKSQRGIMVAYARGASAARRLINPKSEYRNPKQIRGTKEDIAAGNRCGGWAVVPPWRVNPGGSLDI